MHVPVRELAATVRLPLKSVHYHVEDIEVIAAERVTLASPSMNQGARGFTVLVNLDTGRFEASYGSWGGSNMFVQSAVDDDDTELVLAPHMVVIKGQSGHPRTFARIYCAPEAMGRFLPMPASEEPALTETQQFGLNVYRSIKSFARKEYLGRRNVTEQDIEYLIANGYLKRNKAGAISLTTKGKNASQSGKY